MRARWASATASPQFIRGQKGTGLRRGKKSRMQCSSGGRYDILIVRTHKELKKSPITFFPIFIE
jgi:hypothetical protein